MSLSKVPLAGTLANRPSDGVGSGGKGERSGPKLVANNETSRQRKSDDPAEQGEGAAADSAALTEATRSGRTPSPSVSGSPDKRRKSGISSVETHYVASQPNRRRILFLLALREQPVFVAQIAKGIHADERVTSFHLSVLAHHGLVEGKYGPVAKPSMGRVAKFYSLTRRGLFEVAALRFAQACFTRGDG